MKRSPLKRKTPIRRTSRLRARSSTKAYRRRSRDLDFMAYIAKQPCDLSFTGTCEGKVQVDHAGKHGLGEKCPDDQTIPLCKKHHGQKTDYRGYFKDWTGGALRVWLDSRIHHYQHLYRAFVDLGQTPWRKS